jgi:hypothetical protein
MDKGRILVGFGLYERPEEPGAVDMSTYPHATLREAWENLRREVDAGKLNLTVPVVPAGDGKRIVRRFLLLLISS